MSDPRKILTEKEREKSGSKYGGESSGSEGRKRIRSGLDLGEERILKIPLCNNWYQSKILRAVYGIQERCDGGEGGGNGAADRGAQAGPESLLGDSYPIPGASLDYPVDKDESWCSHRIEAQQLEGAELRAAMKKAGETTAKRGSGECCRREDEAEGRGQRRFEPVRKLEMSLFSGDDASRWLVRMEQYFWLTSIAPAQKLACPTMALEGEALTRFEWWEEQTPFHKWMRFKQDFLKRFQLGAAQNPMAPLLEVWQVGDVAQYRQEFEVAARTDRNLGAETLMCIFINGLKKEIQAELEVAGFENLQAMLDKALAIEWRNSTWRETGISPPGTV